MPACFRNSRACATAIQPDEYDPQPSGVFETIEGRGVP
jgi:hypothetical protein